MILDVAVSPNAITEDIDRPLRDLNAMHRRAVSAIHAHGSLTFGSEAELRAWMVEQKKLERVAPSAAKLWEVLLLETQRTGGRWFEQPPPLSEALASGTFESFTRAIASRASVAVLSNQEADAVGVPEQLQSRPETKTGVEVVRVQGVDLAQSFERLRTAGPVLRGTPRDEVWDLWCAGLASHAKEIVIVDRYLGASAVAKSSRAGPRELLWLLQSIHEKARGAPKSVTIVCSDHPSETSPNDRIDAQFIARFLDDSWLDARPSGSIKEIEIITPNWAKWRKSFEQINEGPPHDRWVMFDKARVLEFPAGLDGLSSPTCRRTFTMNYRHDAANVAMRVREFAEIKALPAHTASRVVIPVTS